MAIKQKVPSPSQFAEQVKQQENTSVNNNVKENPIPNNAGVKKFTDEEIKEIESLQNEFNQITYQLGQLSISEIKLKEAKEQALTTLNSIEEKEKTLAASLNKKYGKGTLDIKTREFTPTK
jgi:small-conductance mechanosensitive channel